MISRKPGGQPKAIQVFKQRANYEWDENAEYVISGAELNILLKSLQAAADNPDFKRNAAIFQGLSAINNVFKESVEQGLIEEVSVEAPKANPPQAKVVKKPVATNADVAEPE